MASVASSSRRTRASVAASTSASAAAAAERIQYDRMSRRRTTTSLQPANTYRMQLESASELEDDGGSSSSSRNDPQPVVYIPERLDEEDEDDAMDEALVLEQVTPRPNRRVMIDNAQLDTTQSALDRFRATQKRGIRPERKSIAAPPSAVSSSSRSQAFRPSRQSAPLARTTISERSDSRSMYTARSRRSELSGTTNNRASRRSAVLDLNDTSADEPAGNTTMARPGQRLRPSLALPDGRLDVPTIEERCAALVINAKGVLHFYMDLYTLGWRPESFDDMMRNWAPFESYKTNQLLAEAQYMHHFIDIDEVKRSLNAAGQPLPDGFEEAMKMANCATFVHYIHQLPTQAAEYGRRSGQLVTSADVLRAPLRNISELSDARRIFLRWILPFDWELTDEVLNMLLDMSIQIFIHRLERIVRAARAGEMSEEEARTAASDLLIDLMSGDVVRHSLQRVKRQRNISRAEIERMVQRYETFANVRQIDLQAMGYDFEAMRDSFSFASMSADLTGYVRDVVREVDAGMHSTTLPLIIDRLARESSVFSESDVPEIAPSSSSRFNDASSAIAGPTQSTPKATAQGPQASQAFASQYANWLDDMLQDDESQATTRNRSAQNQGEADLTATQKMNELDAMLQESGSEVAAAAEASSVDLDVASSPPRTNQLGARMSAALHSSGRTHERGLLVEAVEVSETSDATGGGDLRRTRDGPFDSPAKERASRIGFDKKNRLVRQAGPAARRSARMLDGSAAAVRESRFDSQGEEEEDVFLENATRKKSRGKRKAKEVTEDGPAKATRSAASVAEASAASATRRSTRADIRKSYVTEITTEEEKGVESGEQQQEEQNKGQQGTEEDEDSADSDVSDDSEPQTARRTGSRSAPRQLELKRESASPIKTRAQLMASVRQANDAAGPAAAATTSTRAARAAARAAASEGGATGLGRGLPDDAARSDARILSTASGRLVEEGSGSEPGDATQEQERAEGVDGELGAVRSTPDANFVGDDDGAILDRRAALDAALAARRPRPGTLQFYHPAADEDAVPLPLDDAPPGGENVDAIAMRNADSVAQILHSSDAVVRRRIGPYRPGGTRDEPVAEEDDPIRGSDDEEVDELDDDEPPRRTRPAGRGRRARSGTQRTEPAGQAVRVQPYKRSNLYVTGHNMTGRAYWTDSEVSCLLSSLHELARYKKVAPKFKVYAEILRRHGVHGSESTTLARWNNVQLKDKSRNELMRMRREGLTIPYWKRLLHPNIWKPPVHRVRDETEDVPDVDAQNVPQEAGDDQPNPLTNVD
ncbi:hypothetical protein PaG_03264 [Moesziomyces aphidis]|uniref:Uncharacterized protein n=1 Tax=Moesziomyces aphidis TaxID=84754 RepID=W3VLT6_MOEAP|nr:hypothetical protein PaG_03264 [Moesziomyces aphidis]